MPNTGEEYSVISKRGLSSLRADQSILEGLALAISETKDASE